MRKEAEAEKAWRDVEAKEAWKAAEAEVEKQRRDMEAEEARKRGLRRRRLGRSSWSCFCRARSLHELPGKKRLRGCWRPMREPHRVELQGTGRGRRQRSTYARVA